MSGVVKIKPVDPPQLVAELRTLGGGAVDTSTLIYLDKCSLLETVADHFHLLVAPGVAAEFGRFLPPCTLCPDVDQGETDTAVLALAAARHVPLFSEDRHLLQRCRKQAIPYYNTLMLLLALLIQGKIDDKGYHNTRRILQRVARYSPAVWQVGDEVFTLFAQSGTRGQGKTGHSPQGGV